MSINLATLVLTTYETIEEHACNREDLIVAPSGKSWIHGQLSFAKWCDCNTEQADGFEGPCLFWGGLG